MNYIYKNNKILLTALLVFSVTFTLSSCNNTNTSSSNSSLTETYGEINQKVLDEFKNSPIKYQSTLNNSDASSSYVSNVELKISEGRYQFKEVVAESEYVTTDIKLFENEDGYASIKSINIDNEVEESLLYYESNNQYVVFADYYLNPFQYITLEDLVYNSAEKTYSFENQEPLTSFFNSLNYYGETIIKFNFKYNIAENHFEIYYESETKNYNVIANGVINISDEEVEDVVAYEHQDYHDEISQALEELDNTNNYTYTVRRIDLDEKYEEQTLTTYFTNDVILYPADDFTSVTNDYGVAKFNDGTIRNFDVIDGKVIPGTKADMYRPVYQVVAPELYQKVGENTYQLDSITHGSFVAASMANTYDEETLIEYFGISSKFQIVVKDGHLESFSYVISRVYSDYIVYNELCVVTISNINETKIDENLVFEVNDEETIKPKYLGTWIGENRIGDCKEHTLVISESSITLDGQEASSITFDPTDGYSFVIDDTSYVASLNADGTLFVYDVASSTLNMIASKN